MTSLKKAPTLIFVTSVVAIVVLIHVWALLIWKIMQILSSASNRLPTRFAHGISILGIKVLFPLLPYNPDFGSPYALELVAAMSDGSNSE